MGRTNQGAFKGTNRLCQQCVKECKQFSNVTVIKYNFASNQKSGDTLVLAENTTLRAKEAVNA